MINFILAKAKDGNRININKFTYPIYCSEKLFFPLPPSEEEKRWQNMQPLEGKIKELLISHHPCSSLASWVFPSTFLGFFSCLPLPFNVYLLALVHRRNTWSSNCLSFLIQWLNKLRCEIMSNGLRTTCMHEHWTKTNPTNSGTFFGCWNIGNDLTHRRINLHLSGTCPELSQQQVETLAKDCCVPPCVIVKFIIDFI